MALKISQLPKAPALSGDELFEIAESGSSRSVPASGISTYIGAEGYSKTLYVDTQIASVSAAADQAFTNELYVDTQIASVSAAADQSFTNELYVDTQIASVSAAADQAFTNELYVDTQIASVSAAAEQYTNTQIAAISGATGSFIASGGETVTVVNGLITSIV